MMSDLRAAGYNGSAIPRAYRASEELSVLRHEATKARLRRPPDLVVVWRVYEHCRLGCAFCGYSRTIHRPRYVADAEDLFAFGRILGDYQQLRGKSILVSWLGGEPLEWPRLAEVSHAFCEEYGLRVGVTTNGLPLQTAAVRSSLLADYDQVTVSIDGPAAFHDRVRGMPGLFERVRRYVARLRAEDAEEKLLLRVNTILMRDNIESFPDFCRSMASWGFDELTFNQLGGNDRPEFYPDHRLLPGQVEWLREQLPDIRRRAAKRGMTIRAGERYLERIARSARNERWSIGDCQPATRLLFIDEHGRVSPCSFTSAGYGIALAELDSPEAIDALAARFAQRQSAQRLPACDDCLATHVFDKFREPESRCLLPV
jgi:MoaA/NifB/PqqE/SkfB family radical SAM enzyme